MFSRLTQMRARRLRRLGLIGGETLTTATSSTDTTIANTSELTENVAKPINTAAKNLLNEETDENQRKQKLQKFDNERKLEIVLNNNDLTAPPQQPHLSSSLKLDMESKSMSNHLTQRSRLLDQFEKQQIENKLNQNSTQTSTQIMRDVEMEIIEENSSKANKSTDGESSIEKMETDELPSAIESSLLTKTTKINQTLTQQAKERESEICLSRILDVFWHDHCEGSIIVSETAAFYKDVIIDDGKTIQFEDFTFQLISEVIVQYFDGKRIDYKVCTNDSMIKGSSSSPSVTMLNTLERMDTSPSCSATPNLKPHNLANHGALNYLIQSYLRCCVQQERYNSMKNREKFNSVVLDVIAQVKKQLIISSKLLLNGTLVKQLQTSHAQTHRSILLKMMYEDAVPSDFLSLLVEESYKEPRIFAKIFGTLTQNLYVDMTSRVVCKDLDTSPINILKQLVDITINGNIRPICNLVTSLPNFCPVLCTQTKGREIVKAGYMGPFLSLSLFSEENPKLGEDVDENWKDTFGNSLRMVSNI